jgi:PAS domain S-box-containing protein
MQPNVPEVPDADKQIEPIRLELEHCQRELARCQARLAQMEGLYTYVADAIWVEECDGQIIDVNPAASALLGYTKEEFLTMYPWDFVTSASRDGILATIDGLKSGAASSLQRVCRSKNGEERVVSLSLRRNNFCGRDLIIATGRDVTQEQRNRADLEKAVNDCKRSEALLQGEKNLTEMIARGDSLNAILNGSCRLAEQVFEDALAIVMLLDQKNNSLRAGAAPSFPDYMAAVDGFRIDPEVGTCSAAAARAEQVITQDISTDPHWANYRELASRHGLRAGWATPILSSSGQVLGTFALYWTKPGSPTGHHLQIINQIARLVAFAIERMQVAETLRASENYARGQAERLEEAQRIAHVGYWERDLNMDLIAWSDETYRIFGIPPQSSILSLSGLINRIHPEDRETVCRAVSEAQNSEKRYDVEYRVIRPNGELRFVHSSGDLIKDESDRPRRMFGTIQDITDQKRAEQALRASEGLARGQLQALSRTLDALATETDPDRTLEHVLRTITAQLDADSDSVWLKDSDSGLMVFKFGLEDGRFKTKSEPAIAAITPSMPVQAFAPWYEILRTGKPSVMEDVREGPEFPWRAHVLARGIVTILWIPILIAGSVEGVIGVRFARKRTFRPQDLELAQSLANQAMLAIQLARLSARSRQTAVIEERNRMARDIHDALSQGFTGVILHLEAAGEAISRHRAEVVSAHLRSAGEIARDGLREARRSVRALRPLALDEKNVAEALEGLVGKLTAGTSVQAKFALEGEPQELPTEWDANILRIGQEVLTNVLRHARATELEVQLVFGDAEVRLKMSDNGCGFNSAGKHEGFGLRGIAERVEKMGGQLSIQSASGAGSSISVVLPLQASTKPEKL